MLRPLGGTFIVAVTPLDENRSLDEDSYRRLLEYYSAAGVNGLTVLGESAERGLLSEHEKERILAATFESVGGKLPIVVGTGSESLETTIRSSGAAQALGASAVMIPPPIRLRTSAGAQNENEIFDYLSSVSETIQIPIVVQDFPQADRPKMSVELIVRLSREVPNVKYLKLEDPPTPQKLAKIREAAGDGLRVFSALYGRDSYWDMLHGAVGIMTSSPTPEYLVAMEGALAAGDRKKAFDVYLNTLPLVYYCTELGLAVRKEVLVKRGVIRTSRMKLREKELDDDQKEGLAEVLGWVEQRVLSSCGVVPLGLAKAR